VVVAVVVGVVAVWAVVTFVVAPLAKDDPSEVVVVAEVVLPSAVVVAVVVVGLIVFVGMGEFDGVVDTTDDGLAAVVAVLTASLPLLALPLLLLPPSALLFASLPLVVLSLLFADEFDGFDDDGAVVSVFGPTPSLPSWLSHGPVGTDVDTVP